MKLSFRYYIAQSRHCDTYCLSEYTVRLWVHQNKVKYRRAGKGERGKILVSKNSLLEYINRAAKLLLSE